MLQGPRSGHFPFFKTAIGPCTKSWRRRVGPLDHARLGCCLRCRSHRMVVALCFCAISTGGHRAPSPGLAPREIEKQPRARVTLSDIRKDRLRKQFVRSDSKPVPYERAAGLLRAYRRRVDGFSAVGRTTPKYRLSWVRGRTSLVGRSPTLPPASHPSPACAGCFPGTPTMRITAIREQAIPVSPLCRSGHSVRRPDDERRRGRHRRRARPSPSTCPGCRRRIAERSASRP